MEEMAAGPLKTLKCAVLGAAVCVLITCVVAVLRLAAFRHLFVLNLALLPGWVVVWLAMGDNYPPGNEMTLLALPISIVCNAIVGAFFGASWAYRRSELRRRFKDFRLRDR